MAMNTRACLGVFQEGGYLSGQLSYDFKAVRDGQISARRNEKVLMDISVGLVFIRYAAVVGAFAQ